MHFITVSAISQKKCLYFHKWTYLFQGVSQVADMCVARHTAYKHTTSVDEFYDVVTATNDTLEEIDSN